MKLQDFHRNLKPRYVDTDVWASISDSPAYRADKDKVFKVLLTSRFLTMREINERFKTSYLADILNDLQSDGLIEIDTKNPLITKYRKLTEKKTSAEPRKSVRFGDRAITKNSSQYADIGVR